MPSPKSSIWDNFDIINISIAGFKLEYISPEIHGESSIASNIEYWRTAVISYVLGAPPSPPPLPQVIQGFIQRLWKKHGTNKMVMLKNGINLVRFETMEGKNEVLQGTYSI